MNTPQPQKTLSVFDSVCVIIGIIIGAGIYETAPTVAASMGSASAMLGIWLLGGLIALAGALNYSELATAYPRQGGDYVYLTHAFGRPTGFLFGWTQLVIIRPGDIALMAFVFGRYASALYPFALSKIIYAATAIIILSIINILGVRQSKWTQNLLTVIKVIGLLAIVAAGLLAPQSAQQPDLSSIVLTEGQTQGLPPAIPLALILVLYTFGGWNEMAYVAAEVKNPARNISRALIFGTVAVTVLYLLANGAFLNALGYSQMAASEAVAADALAITLPAIASRLISILICVSALGAVNGLIFTGARISYALGTEHALFGFLGHWHRRLGTPLRSLMLQGFIGLVIVLCAGSFLDTILYTAPVVWLFFTGTCASVWILRRKDPLAERPFKVPLYPIPTVLFAAACVFMLYSSAAYAVSQRPLGFAVVTAILAAGAIIYGLTKRRNH
ncbi:MAG: amino acid permease [Phycisphaerae bacterium]|nr:amino acid permease [Phycisphaerae bacterium]